MKKLLLILFAACLASCSTYSPLINFVDYSTYNDQGMFLTESNSVSFEYEPVGSVNVLLYSGYVTSSPDRTVDYRAMDYRANGYVPTTKVNYQDATIQEALRIAVEKAKEQGANVIINLQYSFIPAVKTTPPGWRVSGMAAKR